MLDCYDDPTAARPVDGREQRPHIGMLFECCGVYTRLYRHQEEGCYRGRCPKCLGTLVVRVGPDGVSTRIFRAS